MDRSEVAAPEPEETWGALIRRNLPVVVWCLGIAIVLLAGSFIIPWLMWWPTEPPNEWAWLEGVLVNLGAAVLLIVPIELFASRLRRKVEESEERQAANLDEVRTEAADRVSDLEKKVASLSELKDQLRSDLDARTAADEETFRAFVDHGPTYDSVERAVTRAHERKLVPDHGLRVPVSSRNGLRVVFHSASSWGLTVDLEWINGDQITSLSWTADQGAQQFLFELGEAIERAGHSEQPDPELIFSRLSESLVLAARVHDIRPLIEFFPPQWALTQHGLERIADDGNGAIYTIAHDAYNRVVLDRDIKRKSGLDFKSYDAAHEVASYLFEVSMEQQRYADQQFRQEYLAE